MKDCKFTQIRQFLLLPFLDLLNKIFLQALLDLIKEKVEISLEVNLKR